MFNPSIRLSVQIWLRANLVLGVMGLLALIFGGAGEMTGFYFLFLLGAGIGSLPIAVVLAILLPFIKRQRSSITQKCFRLYAVIFFLLLAYGFAGALLESIERSWNSIKAIQFFQVWGIVSGLLLLAAAAALALSHSVILTYFGSSTILNQLNQQSNTIMEHPTDYSTQAAPVKTSNTILYKGIITGVLILLMMIPSLFISNLVQERKLRQQGIVEEVSSKWASSQTIAGFYLSVPYDLPGKDEKGVAITIRKELVILPEELKVSSQLIPEIRPRSIYKVLLYKSTNLFTGRFDLNHQATIDPLLIRWSAAKICLGLTDIKGIEERVVVNFMGRPIELSPGLPGKNISETGLSAPVDLLDAQTTKAQLNFNSALKLKGSEKLHFLPLAGNSEYSIKSSWTSPSFDGNYLPGVRIINDSGFQSSWSFNKANLPFGTMLPEVAFEGEKFSFGVTMLQPSDQYAKTERSVKYAILFIGLTFSLFFIIELMQKNPVHPVQYVLIGIALSIFYTLLLSMSEFILFDLAYLVAAAATVLLITLYAKGHFGSWKTGAIFGSVLSALYGFTFVLVRLEDTALLIGSIGLFMVLALVMYASRKINWYGATN